MLHGGSLCLLRSLHQWPLHHLCHRCISLNPCARVRSSSRRRRLKTAAARAGAALSNHLVAAGRRACSCGLSAGPFGTRVADGAAGAGALLATGASTMDLFAWVLLQVALAHWPSAPLLAWLPPDSHGAEEPPRWSKTPGARPLDFRSPVPVQALGKWHAHCWSSRVLFGSNPMSSSHRARRFHTTLATPS